MKGDFSRFSHQPDKHYAAVLMQQGRVTLDADWNEQFDIEDHRWRVQTVDTIGRACAPVDHDGFELTLTPDGSDLIIGPGRIYIDGILVELDAAAVLPVESFEDHGERVVVVVTGTDPHLVATGWVEVGAGASEPVIARVIEVTAEAIVLAGASGLAAALEKGGVLRRLVTYLTQPYYPAAEFASNPADWVRQTHLAYLEVWRRHVTAVEDPEIREVALGGPDTATRVQTVWAVRLLRAGHEPEPLPLDDPSCRDDIERWDQLTAPAAGRMTAEADAAPDPEDDCKVVLDAGYRGLENRLYRVEIHDPGPLGTATFKWSRDNGSLITSIEAFDSADPAKIKVKRLGRDEVFRFAADDRVEVLSDETEFSGVAGTLAGIVGAPDEEERTIVLDADVSGFDGQTNPRVRQWHHPAAPILTGSTPEELELGVKVSFGGGPFRTGDYWVVPARVATGDVEGFIAALPRGIHRHYARLGLVTWGLGGSVDDCRRIFPPLCGLTRGTGGGCATVTVGDGVRSVGEFDDIQEAIDSLPPGGPARVAIGPGRYALDAAIVIRRSELTLTGCGPQTVITASAGDSAIAVLGVEHVRLEALTIDASAPAGAIVADDVTAFLVVDSVVRNVRAVSEEEHFDADEWVERTARRIHEAGEERVEREDLMRLARPPALKSPRPAGPAIHVIFGVAVAIVDNVLHGIPAASVRGVGLDVRGNTMTGGGAWLREGSRGVRVNGNFISDGLGPGVALGGATLGEKLLRRTLGVAQVEISHNRIHDMDQSGIGTVSLRRHKEDVEKLEVLLEAVPPGPGAATVHPAMVADVPFARRDLAEVGASVTPPTVDWSHNRPELQPHSRAARDDLIAAIDVERPAVLVEGRSAELAAGPVQLIDITANEIAGCARSQANADLEAEAVGGIVLRDVVVARIHDNRIYRNGRRVRACGIYLTGCESVDVTDNQVIANGAAAPQSDVDFSGVVAGGHPSPLQVGSFRFRAPGAETVTVRDAQLFRFLLCEEVVEVDLPTQATGVEAIIFGAEPVTVEALSSGDQVVQTVTAAPTALGHRFAISGPLFARLRITGQAGLVALCVGSACRNHQGGVVVNAVSSAGAGAPAARFHDNLVVSPRGQALIMTGAGQMSISDNTLTCGGLAWQPAERARRAEATTASVLAALLRPATVHVWNTGESVLLGRRKSDFSSGSRERAVIVGEETEVRPYTVAATTTGLRLPEGRTLFHGNQVTFRTEAAARFPLSIGVASMDDVAINDNQMDVEFPGFPLIHTLALALTARAGGNRWQETVTAVRRTDGLAPGGAGLATLASYLGAGIVFSQAIGNQANHCVIPWGAASTVSHGNQVAIELLGGITCPDLGKDSISIRQPVTIMREVHDGT